MKRFWLFMVLVLVMGSGYADDKKVTIKGFFQPESTLNFELTKINGNTRTTSQGDYAIERGIGVGAEYLISDNGSYEVLAGFNYMLERQAPKLNRQRITATNGEYDGWKDEDNETMEIPNRVQITSLYIKPRILSGRPADDDVVAYFAGKLSYNSLGWTVGKSKANNGFGIGFSCGVILHDLLDVEFGWDKFGERFTMTGVSGRDGTNLYDISLMFLSAGMRF